MNIRGFLVCFSSFVFFVLKDKTFWATYPKDFQPMSKEKGVRAIILKLKENIK